MALEWRFFLQIRLDMSLNIQVMWDALLGGTREKEIVLWYHAFSQNSMPGLTPYLTENTVRLQCKAQLVNAV